MARDLVEEQCPVDMAAATIDVPCVFIFAAGADSATAPMIHILSYTHVSHANTWQRIYFELAFACVIPFINIYKALP